MPGPPPSVGSTAIDFGRLGDFGMIAPGVFGLVTVSALSGLYLPGSGTSVSIFFGLFYPIVKGLTSSMNFLPVS